MVDLEVAIGGFYGVDDFFIVTGFVYFVGEVVLSGVVVDDVGNGAIDGEVLNVHVFRGIGMSQCEYWVVGYWFGCCG